MARHERSSAGRPFEPCDRSLPAIERVESGARSRRLRSTSSSVEVGALRATRRVAGGTVMRKHVRLLTLSSAAAAFLSLVASGNAFANVPSHEPTEPIQAPAQEQPQGQVAQPTDEAAEEGSDIFGPITAALGQLSLAPEQQAAVDALLQEAMTRHELFMNAHDAFTSLLAEQMKSGQLDRE